MQTLPTRIFFPIFFVITIGTSVYLVSKISTTKLSPKIVEPSPKYIALTFDDGPYGTPTEQILSILKEKQVPATFFVVGKNVEKYPDILKKEFAEGYTIENHSYDHSSMENYTALEFRENLGKAEQIITQTIGVSPAMFRAPYGKTSPAMFAELSSEGFTYVGWNEDPSDWDFKDDPSDKIVSNILKNARPSGVIILHDGRDKQINYPRTNTITALPKIIDHLKERGYTFVTIDQLLNKPAYKKK